MLDDKGAKILESDVHRVGSVRDTNSKEHSHEELGVSSRYVRVDTKGRHHLCLLLISDLKVVIDSFERKKLLYDHE